MIENGGKQREKVNCNQINPLNRKITDPYQVVFMLFKNILGDADIAKWTKITGI